MLVIGVNKMINTITLNPSLDYIERPDETFSRNHLVYEKRGFVGFSDFSIVGKWFYKWFKKGDERN